MATNNKKKIKASAANYQTNKLNTLPTITSQGNYSGDPTMIPGYGFMDRLNPSGMLGSGMNYSLPTLSAVPEIQDTLEINSNQPQASGPKANVGDYASLLRFAPAVGSLVNMLDKDEPAEINLKRQAASERLIPGQVNQAMLDANLDSSYGKAVGNITNMSGGSGGAARANLQGLALSGAKAKADAFSKLSLSNIQNNMQADQFNIGSANRINAGNTNIANREAVMRMQNELAAEAKKEADRNAFFNSLGQVGVEQFQGNVISAANSGYGTDIYGRSTFKPQGK